MAAKFRPLLSATYEDGVNITFPVVGSPKIDGIRALTTAKAYGIHDTSSRTLKNIPNTHIRYHTRDFHFLDGELVVGDPLDRDTWDRTKSAVMTKEGKPDFTYYVFDHTLNLDVPFVDRWRTLLDMRSSLPPYIRVLDQFLLHDMAQLIEFEEWCVQHGFEGAMYRSPGGPYKCGRSTIRESYLVKWKRFERQFARIVGYEEQTRNDNPIVLDALGYAKRASNKENLVPLGTLGAFICQNPKWQGTFKVGTGEGLTADLRQRIWNVREKMLGESIIFDYQVAGSKDAPRIPSFKGFPE